MGRRQRWSWGVVAALAVAALVQQGLGCGPTETPDDQGDPRLEAVLAQVGPGVVEPALDAFVARAEALHAATNALAAEPGDATARATARQAWIEAMTTWQEIEVMQIGPAASSLADDAGQDLRDAIYSWPTTNRCRVDQETATGSWSDPAFFDGAEVNVTGLDALEVVLFTPGVENGCPAHTEPNASGAWAALGEDGVAAARAGYADALAAHLVEVATALAEAWDPAGGDFSGRLPATDDTAAYESQQDAMDALYAALFYLDTRTKDRKLAVPLGLQDCATSACVDGVESRLAGTSHLWIAANLRGFRALFTGGDGAGLDDLLGQVGHGDLSTSILAALDTADAAALALDEPVDVAATGDREPLQALHDAVKAVTDLVKGDLATVLSLEVPQEAAGDND